MIRNASFILNYNEIVSMAPECHDETVLKGVFKIQGKLYDVYLDLEEVVWTLQGTSNTGTTVNIVNRLICLHPKRVRQKCS